MEPREPEPGPGRVRDPLEGLKFHFPSDHAREVDEPVVDPPGKPAPEPESADTHGEGLGAQALHAPFHLGETPLTDPRSVVSSALVHAALLLLASFTVMTVALPRAAEGPAGLRGELEPVDNRANVPKVPGGGGGSPGDIGGYGSVPFVAPAAGVEPPAVGPNQTPPRRC